MRYQNPNAAWISTVNLHRHPSGIGQNPKRGEMWYDNPEGIKKMKPAPKGWSPKK